MQDRDRQEWRPEQVDAQWRCFLPALTISRSWTIQRTLTQLSILLCHRFPRVRKATAEKLYEALLTFTERDIVPEDQLDNVMELLSETKWESGVAELRPVRNKICELAGVPVPTVARPEPH